MLSGVEYKYILFDFININNGTISMTMNLKTVGFIASFAIALQSTYASDKRLFDEEGRCGGKAPQVSCVEDSDHYDLQDLIHLFVNYPDEILLEFLRYDGVVNYIVASFCAPSDPQPGYQFETFTDQACCYRDIFSTSPFCYFSSGDKPG